MSKKSKSSKKKRTCAVIGSNGYIGKHLSVNLKNDGFIVYNYDIQVSSILDNYQQLDIRDRNQIDLIQEYVDFIFILSGLTGTHDGFNQYLNYMLVNEIGLLNILDFCRYCNEKPRLVFISSRLVYKGVDRPLKESDDKFPKTVYAVNKIAGEKLLQIYQNCFDIPFTIFRLCIPYGNLFNSNYSFGTIGLFLKNAFKNKPIILFGDGSQKRTFTHITDICYQIIECIKLKKTKNETYNLAGETFSLRDVASLVAKRYSITIHYSGWPEKDLRIESGHTYFDSSKIASIVQNPISIHLHEWIESLKN